MKPFAVAYARFSVVLWICIRFAYSGRKGLTALPRRAAFRNRHESMSIRDTPRRLYRQPQERLPDHIELLKDSVHSYQTVCIFIETSSLRPLVLPGFTFRLQSDFGQRIKRSIKKIRIAESFAGKMALPANACAAVTNVNKLFDLAKSLVRHVEHSSPQGSTPHGNMKAHKQSSSFHAGEP